ncbi:MAG: energy transducer TonB [Candidatus Sulfotelmatobacter sp.]
MTSSVSLLLPGKCKVKRFYKRVCLPISLLACLGQATFAQCRHSTTLTEEQRELEDRIVVLTLKLSKGGAVRDVSVLEGPEALRARAIKAAKARKYKDRDTWPDPREMMVEVTFPQDGNGAPAIRQAMPAGVSSCVYVSSVRISAEVMQSRLLKRVEPAFPAGVQVEGTVVLRLHIDKNGNVFKVEKVSGPDALVPSVMEAVKSWEYKPLLLNGELIEVETTVELKFPE